MVKIGLGVDATPEILATARSGPALLPMMLTRGIVSLVTASGMAVAVMAATRAAAGAATRSPIEPATVTARAGLVVLLLPFRRGSLPAGGHALRGEGGRDRAMRLGCRGGEADGKLAILLLLEPQGHWSEFAMLE